MRNNEYFSDLITSLSGRNNMIVIPKLYVELLNGDINNAMLLNQVIYWSDRTKRTDGYFYKTYPEWHEELGLSEYQIRNGIKKLESMGWVKTKLKKANGSPTRHYRFESEVFQETILKLFQERNSKNSRNQYEEIQDSLTEITTLDYPEISTEKYIPDSLNEVNLLKSQFDEWWNLYNRKVDRKKSEDKFKKCVKRDGFEKIMDGTRKYLATIKDKQYQKHPTTFLNGENYNDEYESIPVQPDNPYANLY